MRIFVCLVLVMLGCGKEGGDEGPSAKAACARMGELVKTSTSADKESWDQVISKQCVDVVGPTLTTARYECVMKATDYPAAMACSSQ